MSYKYNYWKWPALLSSVCQWQLQAVPYCSSWSVCVGWGHLWEHYRRAHHLEGFQAKWRPPKRMWGDKVMPMSGLARVRLCWVGWISDLPLSAFVGTLLGIDVSSWLGDCPLTYFSQCHPTGLAWIWSSPANVAKPREEDCNLPARSSCWELSAWEREQGC